MDESDLDKIRYTYGPTATDYGYRRLHPTAIEADVNDLADEIERLRLVLDTVTGERDDALQTLAELTPSTSDTPPRLTGWYCTHCPMDPHTGTIEHTPACPEMPEAVKKALEARS